MLNESFSDHHKTFHGQIHLRCLNTKVMTYPFASSSMNSTDANQPTKIASPATPPTATGIDTSHASCIIICVLPMPGNPSATNGKIKCNDNFRLVQKVQKTRVQNSVKLFNGIPPPTFCPALHKAKQWICSDLDSPTVREHSILQSHHDSFLIGRLLTLELIIIKRPMF